MHPGAAKRKYSNGYLAGLGMRAQALTIHDRLPTLNDQAKIDLYCCGSIVSAADRCSGAVRQAVGARHRSKGSDSRASHPASNVVIGENFNSSPIIIPGGNGFTHVRMLSPLGLDYVPVSSVSGNSINVSTANGIILYYGPYTISNFTGGYTGQLLYVTAPPAVMCSPTAREDLARLFFPMGSTER
jgi:hypothetical protein